jgi:hypothetical protein
MENSFRDFVLARPPTIADFNVCQKPPATTARSWLPSLSKYFSNNGTTLLWNGRVKGADAGVKRLSATDFTEKRQCVDVPTIIPNGIVLGGATSWTLPTARQMWGASNRLCQDPPTRDFGLFSPGSVATTHRSSSRIVHWLPASKTVGVRSRSKLLGPRLQDDVKINWDECRHERNRRGLGKS